MLLARCSPLSLPVFSQFISTRFLERPERTQRSFRPPFRYVVKSLTLPRLSSKEGTTRHAGETMQVIEIETQDHQKRYAVIDDEGVLVEPIMRYLKYLDRIGAARNTFRSYAIVLKQFWEYLAQQQLDWQQITLDDLAQFVLWLKLPTGSLHILPAHP